MNLVIPFNRLCAETVIAIRDAGEPATYSPTGHYPEAYFDLLADLWATGETFAIVEQDIIVHLTTIKTLEACSHHWCEAPYPYLGLPAVYDLGCVKFDSTLIARHPDLFEIVGQQSDAQHPQKHWCRLGMWISIILEERGEKRHEHPGPPLGHLGGIERSGHGCVEMVAGERVTL